MDRHPDVELISSSIAYGGRVFRVLEESVRLPSGLRQDLAVVEHPGAVAIAARLDDGRLLLVRQYRHAVGEWLIEVPAGRLEAGEAPLEGARRELEEETGHRARDWRTLATFFPAPGFCSERITLFLATGLETVDSARPKDADEEFELVRLSPREIALGPHPDAKTRLAAITLLLEGR